MRRKSRHHIALRSGNGRAIPIIVLAVLVTWPAHRAEPTTAASSGPTCPEPLAIRVHQGQALFRLATEGPASRYLVVASALGQRGGPFPIRLSARAIEKATPPELAEPEPQRPRRKRPEPGPAPPAPPGTLPPQERSFHLLVREGDPASPSNYQTVRARLRAVGLRVQVYVASDDIERVSAPTLRDLVRTFDQAVWPEAARLFGPARDVDGDGRFTVLLTSWLEHFTAGRQPLDGFVRGADFDRTVAQPLGNACDLMYLNATLGAGPHLRTVLAHEYTHAVIFSRKVLDAPGDRPGRDEDDWLDEALAHLVEDLHGFSRSNLDHRVRAFLAAPERYRLLVEDYFHGDLFRSQGHRGAAYLFLRWCRDAYGPDLLPTLVTSPDHGIANLESATGEAFATLYRRWSVDLVREPVWRKKSGPLDAPSDTLPTLHWVELNGESDCWSAEPTTSHFTVVSGSASGAVEVELTAPADADLQVSVLPLPEGYPHLVLRPSVSGSDDGGPRAVTLSLASGLPVRIDTVRVESLRNRSSDGARPSAPVEMGPAELEWWFGPGRTLEPGRSVVFEPWPTTSALAGPQRIEILGTDARGRLVAVRAELAH